jgi:hypothetical protein
MMTWKTAAINKLGMKTEPAGSLRVRCAVSVTDVSQQLRDGAGGMMMMMMTGDNKGLSKELVESKKQQQVRKTVEDILAAHKYSTPRSGRSSRSKGNAVDLGFLLSSRSNASSVGSSAGFADLAASSPSTAAGAGLLASSGVDKVAEVLARARAKFGARGGLSSGRLSPGEGKAVLSPIQPRSASRDRESINIIPEESSSGIAFNPIRSSSRLANEDASSTEKDALITPRR